jgi:hypothetical protein
MAAIEMAIDARTGIVSNDIPPGFKILFESSSFLQSLEMLRKVVPRELSGNFGEGRNGESGFRCF